MENVDIDAAVDTVLANLDEEVDPRQFLLRFFFKLTIKNLEKYTQKEREIFLVWMTDEILGNGG